MRKPLYPTECKDCGSEEVIRVYYNEKQEEKDHFTVVLCAPCLQSRAQLQRMKEDKMPFHKLLEKIRNETMKGIRHISATEGLKEYKVVNPYAHTSDLANYWVEQLKGDV